MFDPSVLEGKGILDYGEKVWVVQRQMLEKRCPHCHGEGKKQHWVCSTCNGEKNLRLSTMVVRRATITSLEIRVGPKHLFVDYAVDFGKNESASPFRSDMVFRNKKDAERKSEECADKKHHRYARPNGSEILIPKEAGVVLRWTSSNEKNPLACEVTRGDPNVWTGDPDKLYMWFICRKDTGHIDGDMGCTCRSGFSSQQEAVTSLLTHLTKTCRPVTRWYKELFKAATEPMYD